MMQLEVASPSQSESPPASPRYVFMTTDTGTVDIDRDSSAYMTSVQRWFQHHRRAVDPGAAAALLWSTAVEPSFGDGPRWETPHSHVRHPHVWNTHIVASLGKAMPRVKDEVQHTAEIVSSWERSGNGQYASFYVVYFVEQSFRLRAYEQVNRLLEEIDIAPLTEWSLIALLRSSFSARSFLPAWPRLLMAVHEKLQAQGKDTKKLLRGLNR
ncbi:hypothetical protein [Paraburkholderia saeva]|uniref:Uncharacterized protein n=1 Tax=Paraburkholderia saeva TaxID=2777537 RepID=A0A9N8X314_9BURK|nr:hypothetical protein [Paraburkholderia saeva]CAG4906384.1 hypothetical protein LMG31841_03553 [Paraburkholderia saeva]